MAPDLLLLIYCFGRNFMFQLNFARIASKWRSHVRFMIPWFFPKFRFPTEYVHATVYRWGHLSCSGPATETIQFERASFPSLFDIAFVNVLCLGLREDKTFSVKNRTEGETNRKAEVEHTWANNRYIDQHRPASSLEHPIVHKHWDLLPWFSSNFAY